MRSCSLFLLSALTVTKFVFAWNIFGTDNRQPVTSNDAPWRMVGYVDTGCTGTLVGKNLVLTAAHCVMKDDGTSDLQSNLKYFYPNMVNNFSVRKSFIKHVYWGTNRPKNFRADDWAILILEDNLGDIYGWMGVSGSTNQNEVTLVGYSGDYKNGNTATAHVGCYIEERQSNYMLHSCDNTRGASGGPMFSMVNGVATIFGINVSERRDGGENSLSLNYYENDHANIAVYPSRFLPILKKLKGE